MDIQSHWYRSSHTLLTTALLPFSWAFCAVVAGRRALYRTKLKKQFHFGCPLIVVGNITVGGTGKTPFVIWLASFLREQGLKPGIVSRGYGGKTQNTPRRVTALSQVTEVGDEALLLSRRTGCPVVVGVDRVLAVQALLDTTDCNIVISDDGLQHYRMGRTMEIAIVDGIRRFGNGSLLPAGPLRESASRLREVDFVVTQQQVSAGEYQMVLQGEQLLSVFDDSAKVSLSDFKGKKVHAVAAIGDPSRFFARLRDEGLDVIEHPFPDHFIFQKRDIDFQDALPVIMTEKDAVKCGAFSDNRHWYLPVAAKMPTEFETQLATKLSQEDLCG